MNMVMLPLTRTISKVEASNQSDEDYNARVARKEKAIRDEAARIRALELELASERFLRVQSWLQANRSDIASGGPILSCVIADGDSLSLAELEGYGTYGNAIQIDLNGMGDVGELWWCDPEGRPAALQRFAFYTILDGDSVVFSLQYRAAPCSAEAHG